MPSITSTRSGVTRRTALTAGAVSLGVIGLLVPALSGANAASFSAPAATPAPAPCNGPAPWTLNGIGHHDRGPAPTVFNIHKETLSNKAYRDTLWTESRMQLTVMSIKGHDDIGLEAHPTLDQFLRIEGGHGIVLMGPAKDQLTLRQRVDKDSAILVPAGTWHDVINTSSKPLKLYSIYAPANHPRNTYHATKQDGANDPLEKIKCPQDLEGGDLTWPLSNS